MALKHAPPGADAPDVERAREDRGDIVLGWLTRLVVVMAVLGLIGFDVISLGLGRLKAEDNATAAARVGLSAYGESKDVQKAYEAALASLGDPVADTIAPEDFVLADDGSLTVTVQHTAPTLLAEKVGPLRGLTTSEATSTVRPAS